MKKKLLAILTVLTLVVCMFASCGECDEHVDADKNYICDECEAELEKPETPVDPETPDDDKDDTTENEGTANDGNTDDDKTDEPAKELSFFERLIEAILNFFRNLFGGKTKD